MFGSIISYTIFLTLRVLPQNYIEAHGENRFCLLYLKEYTAKAKRPKKDRRKPPKSFGRRNIVVTGFWCQENSLPECIGKVILVVPTLRVIATTTRLYCNSIFFLRLKVTRLFTMWAISSIYRFRITRKIVGQ